MPNFSNHVKNKEVRNVQAEKRQRQSEHSAPHREGFCEEQPLDLCGTAHHQLVESDKPEYPICVDNKWYFEGVEIPENPSEAPKPGRKGGRKA